MIGARKTTPDNCNIILKQHGRLLCFIQYSHKYRNKTLCHHDGVNSIILSLIIFQETSKEKQQVCKSALTEQKSNKIFMTIFNIDRTFVLVAVAVFFVWVHEDDYIVREIIAALFTAALKKDLSHLRCKIKRADYK